MEYGKFTKATPGKNFAPDFGVMLKKTWRAWQWVIITMVLLTMAHGTKGTQLFTVTVRH